MIQSGRQEAQVSLPRGRLRPGEAMRGTLTRNRARPLKFPGFPGHSQSRCSTPQYNQAFNRGETAGELVCRLSLCERTHFPPAIGACTLTPAHATQEIHNPKQPIKNAIMPHEQVQVFGPAYLDRVLRVDRPILDPTLGPPIDQSADGTIKFTLAPTINVIDSTDLTLTISTPENWPGPTGEVRLSRAIRTGARGVRSLRGLDWHDDLGGMGAGYAAALNGTLISALGPADDTTSLAISHRLSHLGIPHQPIRVPDRTADWTLLITSGEFGDKLPIGFRGCHSALEPGALMPLAERSCNLRVVASFPNELSAPLLNLPGAGVRFYAPAMRNMLDRDHPISRFASSIDVLSCNRLEWESLEGREDVGWLVSILVVTDGPNGSLVRYTRPSGDSGLLKLAAFPRSSPPRDTNRAGEAFGATFIKSLLDQGWNSASGVVDDELIRVAATRASAAAALVLDRVEFGFPTAAEINRALSVGRV